MSRIAHPIFLLAISTAALAHDDADLGECEDLGDSSVFAVMPDPGEGYQPTGRTYPEGVAVIGDRVIVSGPATFGTAGNGSPSQLTVFDKDSGALVSEVPVVGELLAYEHALSELASWKNYAYAPSTQLGLLRWDFQGNEDSPDQESVSTPFCSVSGPVPCTVATDACPADIRPGLPPLPNGVAVDKDGTAYVTDSLQGIVWRIPALEDGAAPAEPEVAFCSRDLQGAGDDGLTLFGANGVAIDHDDLYVSVTFGAPDASGVFTSAVYRLDLDDPTALELVHTYAPGEVAPGIYVPPIADGLRWNKETETLFVVLGGQNAVSELDPETGEELARYTRTDADHPFVNPSTIAFGEDGAAYVSNHAITCCLEGDPNPACACTGAADYFGVIELCVE